MEKMIQTTKGELPISLLRRSVIFEERPERFVLVVRYHYEGELVRAEAYPAPLDDVDENGFTETSHGKMPLEFLKRTLTFTETPEEFTIVTEYKTGDGELVKRSAH